jgi:hypothetical protein
MPIEEKAAKADLVIDTSGTFDETTRQIREVWTKLRTPRLSRGERVLQQHGNRQRPDTTRHWR